MLTSPEILVPMDFSPCSVNALRVAIGIAAPEGDLTLLHVIDQEFVDGAVRGKAATVTEESKPTTQAPPGLFDLTSLQREALDEVQRIAASPDTYLDMSIGEGDIQFLNNRLLLHGRTGYEDHHAMADRRHLLRLWLRVPDWPEQPHSQAMHRAEDHPLWLRQRTPFMEVPSRYLAEITSKQAELVG